MNMNQDHAKQTKKMRAVVKKKSQAVDKLAKKARKKAGDAELAEEHEIKVRSYTRAVNDILRTFSLNTSIVDRSLLPVIV